MKPALALSRSLLTLTLVALSACGGGGTGVSGTVTQDGEALAGATVKLFPSTAEEADRLGIEEVAAETTTDDDGGFTFEDVEPGEYSVTVRTDECGGLVPFVTVKDGESATADLECGGI